MQAEIFEHTVDISLKTLIRECRVNNIEFDELLTLFGMKNRDNIHRIFGYKKLNDDFVDRLSCYTDENHIIGSIRPSYDAFLDKLLTILNIKHNSKTVDDEELTKIMLARLDVLRTIKTKKELEQEFPILYRDFKDGSYNLCSLDRNKKYLSEKEFKEKNDYYRSRGLTRTIKYFIPTQVNMYTTYINKRHELKELLKQKSYNSIIRNLFDANKVAMLIIHEYLTKCEKENEIDMIKEYIERIEKYLNSDYDKYVYIRLDNGTMVDINNIKARLNNLKRRVRDKSILVDWILVPNRENRRVGKVNDPEKLLFNYEEIERLKNIGNKKSSFYEQTDYALKVIGLDYYRGYVAYIYPNGKVVLDREFNEDTPSTALGNRIFVMNADDFIKFSGNNKKDLSNNPDVQCYKHSKGWRSKIRSIIDQETSDESKNKARQLILELKEKSM